MICDLCPRDGEVEVIWHDGTIHRLCHEPDRVLTAKGYLRHEEKPSDGLG